MISEPHPGGPDVAPDLVDLDVLLNGVAPLTSPHDWAAPDLFPDDAEFDEFIDWLRAERDHDLA